MAREQRTEDEDVNCRLRHGLNTDCLARIFQYLDSEDLYTVGEMNVFYNQIIKDLVIPEHTVVFEEIFNRDIAEQFFQRYGTKIQYLFFAQLPDTQKKHIPFNQFNQFNQLITQHCSIDQLRDVFICVHETNQAVLVFIPKFKNLEKMELNATHICGADLIDPIKQLAENNTIECLEQNYVGHFIVRTEHVSNVHHNENCIFQEQPNHDGLDMKYFTNLKEINVKWFARELDNNEPNRCDALKLLSLYASQILSNVETVYMYASNAYHFIEFMPKLRELRIRNCKHTSEQAAEILPMVENILDKRSNIASDFINVKVMYNEEFEIFSSCAGINSSIKSFNTLIIVRR